MLYLKPVNYEDIDEEYRAISLMPADENGFQNDYYGVSKEEFKNVVIPTLLNNSKGINLPEGYVPCTFFFLWDDDRIVGLFKIRHYLNDSLRNGAGHIGAGILSDSRGKGYGVEGLKLAIEKCLEIMPEDEVYLSVLKTNIPSIKMQLANHAYLVREKEEIFLFRVNPKIKDITFSLIDLERNDWKKIVDKDVIIDDISTNDFEGKIALLNIKEVEAPLSIDSPNGAVKIVDKGYKHLMIAPKNQNWWLTAVFDENDNLIESYFDITKINCFDAKTPYFIDMKLNVCIPANGKPTIMDDSKLKEVYDKSMITKEDYENAYLIANKLVNFINSNHEQYDSFIYEQYNKLKTV